MKKTFIYNKKKLSLNKKKGKAYHYANEEPILYDKNDEELYHTLSSQR